MTVLGAILEAVDRKMSMLQYPTWAIASIAASVSRCVRQELTYETDSNTSALDVQPALTRAIKS